MLSSIDNINAQRIRLAPAGSVLGVFGWQCHRHQDDMMLPIGPGLISMPNHLSSSIMIVTAESITTSAEQVRNTSLGLFCQNSLGDFHPIACKHRLLVAPQSYLLQWVFRQRLGGFGQQTDLVHVHCELSCDHAL